MSARYPMLCSCRLNSRDMGSSQKTLISPLAKDVGSGQAGAKFYQLFVKCQAIKAHSAAREKACLLLVFGICI